MYFAASFEPQVLALVYCNGKNPSFAISHQLTMVAPIDPKPVSGVRSVNVELFYNPLQIRMVGGVINTYSTWLSARQQTGFALSHRQTCAKMRYGSKEYPLFQNRLKNQLNSNC